MSYREDSGHLAITKAVGAGLMVCYCLLSVCGYAATNKADGAVDILAGKFVAWDSSRCVLAYRECFQGEGAYKGCHVLFRHLSSGKVEDTSIFGDDIDQWAPVADLARLKEERGKAELTVQSMLKEGSFQLMETTAWPYNDKTISSKSKDITLRWSGSSLKVSGKSLAKSVVKPISRRHSSKPHPLAFYSAPEVPFIVVVFEYDPGQAYLEGAEMWTLPEIVVLPQVRALPKCLEHAPSLR